MSQHDCKVSEMQNRFWVHSCQPKAKVLLTIICFSKAKRPSPNEPISSMLIRPRSLPVKRPRWIGPTPNRFLIRAKTHENCGKVIRSIGHELCGWWVLRRYMDHLKPVVSVRSLRLTLLFCEVWPLNGPTRGVGCWYQLTSHKPLRTLWRLHCHKALSTTL